MIGDLIEAFPGVVPFVTEDDVNSYPVAFFEYFLELFMVGCGSFGDQTIDDFLGNQIYEDMGLLEIPFLLILLKAYLYPRSFPMGFQPAGVNTSKRDSLWKKELIDLGEKPLVKIVHRILNGLITRCSFHSERLVDLQIFRRTCNTAIRDTKKDFKQKKNRETGEFEFSPLYWLIQLMEHAPQV